VILLILSKNKTKMSKLDKGQVFVLGFFIGGVCMFICLLPLIKNMI
jgi:hypothetical protein